MPYPAVSPGNGGDWNIPLQFAIGQNYPNSFNPRTVVSYQLSDVSNVKLAVYDMLGREVAVLVNDMKHPGAYDVEFNASGFSSGVYFCRMQAGGFTQTMRLLLMK